MFDVMLEGRVEARDLDLPNKHLDGVAVCNDFGCGDLAAVTVYHVLYRVGEWDSVSVHCIVGCANEVEDSTEGRKIVNNALFSPDIQIPAKKRGCEDPAGNRRFSIHHASAQARLFANSEGDANTQAGETATQKDAAEKRKSGPSPSTAVPKDSNKGSSTKAAKKKASKKKSKRVSRARSWLQSRNFTREILFLQEMKIGGVDLIENIQKVVPDAIAVIDYIPSGKGGAAVVVPPRYKITEQGVSGLGNAAWVKIDTVVGRIGLISIHAPNKRHLRKRTWLWLRELVKEGQWVVGGDFNMVEFDEDTTGESNKLEGGKFNRWHNMAREADLVDARICAIKTDGPLYTRPKKLR
ncbi:hypothetical protein R1sor_008934 [Riccia sorocarpa]|uniref:Endonuclease/exonuclease/phosphatase domain-containing protein n=1 Tax=Riccia sorocarpa TaxID=122646 RepID=A0ABD3H7V1_9MARC